MAVNNMSSMLRISGISSGLDTDSMVKSLMKLEQLRVDQVMRQKTKMEWARDLRQDINKQINDVRYSYASVLSDKNLNSTSAFRANKVEMLTNTGALNISVNSDAGAGTHTIDSITQIAKAAQVSSSARVSEDSLVRSATLADLSLSTALTFDSNDEISFKINEETFTFKSSDTLDSMLRTINTSDAGINMSYSAISGGFKIESNTVGASSNLTIENISGNAFANNDVDASAFGLSSTSIVSGQNAILSVDGYTIEQDSNNFVLDGIIFDLKTDLAEDQPVTFSVSQDIDSVVENVKSFINDYNELLDSLNGKLTEKIQYSYEPLTDEQKEEMSETEIENWEEMAKSGLMRNDRKLSGLLSDMRDAIYQKVSGVDKSLFDIGIKTGNWMDRGKLVLDEDKLRAELQKSPDDVAAVFAQKSTSSDPVIKKSETGFMEKIATSMGNYTSDFNIIKVELDIGKVAEKISKLQDEMYAKEETYWSKFAAMESALGSLNSQSSWLSQQISTW